MAGVVDVSVARAVQRGLTALMCTAMFGHTATAVELLRLGADINGREKNVRWAILGICM